MWKSLSSLKRGESRCPFCFFRMKVPLWKRKSCQSSLRTSGMKLVSGASAWGMGRGCLFPGMWTCNKSSCVSINNQSRPAWTDGSIFPRAVVGSCSLGGGALISLQHLCCHKGSLLTVHSGNWWTPLIVFQFNSPLLSEWLLIFVSFHVLPTEVPDFLSVSSFRCVFWGII